MFTKKEKKVTDFLNEPGKVNKEERERDTILFPAKSYITLARYTE